MRKDIDLIDVEASPELDPIIRIDVGQLKLPMRDGYMPTPTLPVACQECSTIGFESPKDAITDGFLNDV